MTWIPEALRALSLMYVVLVLVALAFALIKPKTAMAKALWALGVLTVFGWWPVSTIVELRSEQQARQARYQAAKSRFEERCADAGVRIYRTVEGVEAVLLLKGEAI